MGSNVDNVDVGGISFVGAHQTTPEDATNKTQSTTSRDPVDISLTSTVNDTYLISCIQFFNAGGGSASGGQTEFLNGHSGFNVASYSAGGTSGTETHSYTRGANDWGILNMVAVKPATGGGAVTRINAFMTTNTKFFGA